MMKGVNFVHQLTASNSVEYQRMFGTFKFNSRKRSLSSDRRGTGGSKILAHLREITAMFSVPACPIVLSAVQNHTDYTEGVRYFI